MVGCALVVEILYEPPLWLHALLWLPLILATTLLPLRPMKGLMIALQYHHKAAEGRGGRAVNAERKRNSVLLPGAFALVGLLVLLGLGTWQIERKAWKEALIARLTRRAGDTPRELPPPAEWLRHDAGEFGIPARSPAHRADR